MKNIVKSIAFAALFTSLVGCEGEDNFKYVEPEGEFQILSPVSGEGAVLSPETPLNPGLSLTWEDMNYGTPTEVTYTIEVDKSGDEFDTPLVLTQTTNTYATVTSDALNGAAVGAGLTPFTQGGLEVRIKSSIGSNDEMPHYSNVITYLVTPYSTDLPKLAVPGNHQGWNPPTAPRIAASAFGETDYEGYIWLDGGFKFVAPDPAGNFNWGNTDWGDDGSFSNALVESGESDCSAAAGYYRVRANTTTLVYSVEPTTWGIVGAATPGGWDASTALTYNSTNKTWEGDVTLSAGEFKFRANNAWTINLGGDPDEDGSMNYDGPNLSVGAGGSYHVVLDLSNPRKYSYTLTAN
ncbi:MULTISPECIES: SusE domain-containing protein [unclassified Flavobacterium]|uniref:SusE domain-containing protein n=1 Tax=unclassified Flavobacterium TaxID=196869 RepID=UPI001F1296D6|nr:MULTISPECIES: SusE domain-containing protein [unclassified Flavobacterium]UMY65953.1 SusE domain-containing protein [Flavobacterium sp. HJ-32-4]